MAVGWTRSNSVSASCQPRGPRWVVPPPSFLMGDMAPAVQAVERTGMVFEDDSARYTDHRCPSMTPVPIFIENKEGNEGGPEIPQLEQPKHQLQVETSSVTGDYPIL